jgi:hypothetical protein
VPERPQSSVEQRLNRSLPEASIVHRDPIEHFHR